MLNTVNPANLVLSPAQWLALGPYIIVACGVLGTMLLGTFSFASGRGKIPLLLLSVAVMLGAAACTGMHWVKEPLPVFGGAIVLDYFSSFFNLLLCLATALVMLGSGSYLEEDGTHYSEFYPILMASTLGMMLISAAAELLTLFVSIELMSLMVYVLVGIRRRNACANEASVKYFVMGGVAAAIYLYGMALVYGAVGSTRLPVIMVALTQQQALLGNPILIAGIVLLLVGFLFKVAAAPFHMWTPDVYEGAPANVTAYMATALKAAVFAALVRVSVAFFGDQGVHLLGGVQGAVHAVLWCLALLTMLIGNLVALMQTSLKRLMAYSAIAHTGYLLVGLLAGPSTGYSGVIFYLVAYVAMNIGAFLLLSLFSGKEDSELTSASLAGLGQRHPFAAAALTVFLLSLGGFPPTAGFVGKYYLFSGALAAGETLLVLVAVLTSAVSVFYYLRLVVLMYMHEGTRPLPFRAAPLAIVAIAICLLLTMHYGIFPGPLLHTVKKAAVF